MSNVNKGLPPERPVIPAEVADAIEALRSDAFKYTNEHVLYLLANGLTTDPTVKALSSIPFDTFLAALVNGYERELTEEERKHSELKQSYLSGRRGDNWYFDGYADGIKHALDTLGVKIEGVNA